MPWPMPCPTALQSYRAPGGSPGAIKARARRLAPYLHEHGLGWHTERVDLAGHESKNQAHLALMLYNDPVVVEGMLGAYGARVAPFNVNYRYVGNELRYLFNDAKPRGVICRGSMAPVLAPLIAEMKPPPLLLQVQDSSGNDLLPGAVNYEAALESANPAGPPVTPTQTIFTSSIREEQQGDAQRRALATARHLHGSHEQAASSVPGNQ